MAGPGSTAAVDAIVLRSLRYGESDVIVHLFSLEQGRTSAIAKGARKARSRLGARPEPFTRVRLQLRTGRGDLALVAGVDMVASHQRLRESYRAQQVAASALHTLQRLTHEQAMNEQAFHLTCNFLHVLDGEAAQQALEEGDVAPTALLLAYRLKLLHTAGIAPNLQACARCGRSDGIAAWSARDGGVVCTTCEAPGDAPLEAHVRQAAAWALATRLHEVVEGDLRSGAAVSAADRVIAGSMCAEHAGFRPRAAFG